MRTLICTGLLVLALPLTAGLVRADDEQGDSPATAKIEQLIEQLGADDFRTREAASKELAKIGPAARPALEQAARDSKSPEVRWRAGQLLQQMQGAGEKPLGSEEEDAPEAKPEGPSSGANPFGPGSPFGGGLRGDGDMMERVKKLMEALRERGGSNPLDMLRGLQRIEAPGLVLERTPVGQMKLRVKREAEAGQAQVEDVYVGRSLADILERNPELLEHAGMEELKRQDAKQSWPGLEDFFKRGMPGMPGVRVVPFPGGTGFGMTSSSGVSITQGADGVTVKITERGEDGKESTKEYKGESLEQIKKDHPEIADKLGNFSVSLRFGPPDFFFPGQRKRGLEPLRKNAPVTPFTPRALGPLFGLELQAPDEALSSQLRLEIGQGAIVREVKPGSQADKLGIRRHDLILSINGTDVTLETAVRALRAAAADPESALDVELVRRGERRTLTR